MRRRAGVVVCVIVAGSCGESPAAAENPIVSGKFEEIVDAGNAFAYLRISSVQGTFAADTMDLVLERASAVVETAQGVPIPIGSIARGSGIRAYLLGECTDESRPACGARRVIVDQE